MAEGQNVCSENKEIRETMRQMRVVNKGIRKVDAKALVTGRAVYTNDIASSDSLIEACKKPSCSCADQRD